MDFIFNSIFSNYNEKYRPYRKMFWLKFVDIFQANNVVS